MGQGSGEIAQEKGPYMVVGGPEYIPCDIIGHALIQAEEGA